MKSFGRLLAASAAAAFSHFALAQVSTEISLIRTVFTPWDGFKATVGEPSNDSKRAFLGVKQETDGNILRWPSAAMGVSNLFASDRSASDTRMVDLALNGTPALIGITHSCTNDTVSAAKLFTFNGTNYAEVPGF